MKIALIFMAITLAWYGICVFVSLEPNPTNWPIEGRLYFVLLEVLCVPLILRLLRT